MEVDSEKKKNAKYAKYSINQTFICQPAKHKAKYPVSDWDLDSPREQSNAISTV